jgi:hypothetical protein
MPKPKGTPEQLAEVAAVLERRRNRLGRLFVKAGSLRRAYSLVLEDLGLAQDPPAAPSEAAAAGEPSTATAA